MTTASLEDLLLKNVRRLPDEQQRQVLRFAEALVRLQAAHNDGRSIVGILEGQGYHVSEEDIAEARREMWGNSPRDLPE